MYLLGGAIQQVRVADVDGDGHPDVLVTDVIGNLVAVMRGSSDGTLGTTQYNFVGALPHGLAVSDLDGDGDLDIATSNTGSGTVTVLRGDGVGHFGDRADVGVGGSPVTMLAGDLDDDGSIDLVAGETGATSILRRHDDGTFAISSRQSNSGLTCWTEADFNEDGRQDIFLVGPFYCLAYTDNGKRCVSFSTLAQTQLSRGVQDFEIVNVSFYAMDPGQPGLATAGDVDLDGRPDVMVRGADRTPVIASSGSGLFVEAEVAEPRLFTGIGLGGGRFSYVRSDISVGGALQPGDFDGDGWPDAVTTTPHGVRLLHGTGTGVFVDAGELPTLTPATGLGAGDLNGDGRLDLVVGSGSYVSVLLNAGPVPPLPPPARIDAHAEEAGVRLEWSPVPGGMSSYRVTHGPVSDPTSVEEIVLPSDQHTVDVSCLPDVPWRFGVAAVGIDGRPSVRERTILATARPVSASLRITPQVLRSAGNGDLMARLRIGDPWSLGDVDVTTLELNGRSAPVGSVSIARNGDDARELLLRIARSSVDVASAGGVLHLRGRVGVCSRPVFFAAEDTVRILTGGRVAAEPLVATPNEESPVVAGEGVHAFALKAVTPVPARGATLVRFDVPRSSVVSINILDVGGRVLSSPWSRRLGPGRHKASISLDNLAPGVYFLRIVADTWSASRRIVKIP